MRFSSWSSTARRFVSGKSSNVAGVLAVSKTLRAQFDLRGRLLAADVDDRRRQAARRSAAAASICPRRAVRRRASGCPGRCRRRARLELVQSGAHARDARVVDVAQRDGAALGAKRSGGGGARRDHAHRPLVERVPCVALRAAPEPARRFEPAPRAEVDRTRFCHVPHLFQGEGGFMLKRPARAEPRSCKSLSTARPRPGKTTVARTRRRSSARPVSRYRRDVPRARVSALHTQTEVDNENALVRLLRPAPRSREPGPRARRWAFASSPAIANCTQDDLESPEVTSVVSTIAAHPRVREAMVREQRRIARRRAGRHGGPRYRHGRAARCTV